MTRKILVPIRADGKGETVLGYAAAVAQRLSAHVVATHCRPRLEDLSPYGVPVPAFLRQQFSDAAANLAGEEEKRLRKDFERQAERYGLRVTERPEGGGPSVSWIEAEGRQIDVIKRQGRLADLIVVAKPDRDRNLGANTLKSALFSTGRPVLMCPPGSTPETLGARLAIAWNGSVEAARAVALTMDLILQADAVTVLTAGREEIHGATAADLIDYLAIRGVSARVDNFAAKGAIGRALLKRSAEVEADVLIMGAYSDSHERETIFGGNTQVVVDTAANPVILVH